MATNLHCYMDTLPTLFPVRVLLIEDNPDDAVLIAALLDEAEFCTIHCSNLAKAITELNLSKFDVVLMDLGLPDARGVEGYMQLRAHAEDVPTIILAGLADELIGSEVVVRGAQDYVVKDKVSSDQLSRAIRYAIERKRSELIVRRSELELSEFFETSAVGLRWLSADGIVLRANQAELDMLGYTADEYIGADIRTFHVDPNVIDSVLTRLSTVRTSIGCETQMVCKDGSIKTVFIDCNGHWQKKKFVHSRFFTRDITQWKSAEARCLQSADALEEREARMRIMIDTAPDGIFTMTLDGTIESASEVMHEIFGYDAQELLGQNILRVVPSLVEMEENYFPSNLTTWQGKVVGESREHKGIHKNGAIVPVDLAVSILNLGGRQIMTGILRDITQRKKSEKRLMIQHEITQVLAEAIELSEATVAVVEFLSRVDPWESAGLWLANGDVLRLVAMRDNCRLDLSEFTASSHESTLRFGEGLLGSAWASSSSLWINSEGKGDDRIHLTAAARKSGLHTTVAVPVCGRRRKVLGVLELCASTICDPDKEFLEMIEAMASQVGQFIERKRTEELLKESEKLFRQVAANICEVFWVSTPNMDKYFFVSRAYEEIFGRSIKDLYEKPRSFFDAILPEDLDCARAHVTRQQTDAEGSQAEFRIMRPDGAIRWVWVRAFPIYDESEQVVKVSGVFNDITERKEAESRVSNFYSTVSHELRTPLTSIKGSLGLIEGGLAGEVSERSLQFIKIARSEAERLIRLINDILDIKKMEAGKMALKPSFVQPSDVTRQVLMGMCTVADAAGIKLESRVDILEKIFCDRDRIIQVLTNFISNAINVSPRGARVLVTARFNSRTSSCRFSVADSGPGIPQEQIDQLFGVFHQLDASDSRKKGGTGLGLAISKAIVEAHKGEVGVESIVGKGAVFWFEVPVLVDSCQTQEIEMPKWKTDSAGWPKFVQVEKEVET